MSTSIQKTRDLEINKLCAKSLSASFLLLFCSIFKMDATSYPITFQQRVEQSKQMVMGKVLEHYCFWDDSKENIYTAYKIKVNAYLKKGNDQQFIELITLGGVVADEAQIVYPNITLNIGANYFFFLENLPLSLINNSVQARTSRSTQFCAYAHSQGVLPLEKGQYLDYLSAPPMSVENVLQRVRKITQFNARRPTGELFQQEVLDAVIKSYKSNSIKLKNGLGEISNRFYAGTVEEVNELIISGTGFGVVPGKVQFSNTDAGGVGFISSNYETDLIYWTDSEVRVKIPPKAGTGFVEVVQANGNVVGSATIIIDWALNPVFSTYRGFEKHTRQRVKFLNNNESGGYTLQVNTTKGFLGDTDALESFERALTKWQCNTGLNFQLDKTGTTDIAGNDGNCTIQYSENLPTGVLGIATSRYKSTGNSACSGEKTLWFLKEFDIQFSPEHLLPRGYQWNFSRNPPASHQFDFESIALHELGHAHGLGHIVGVENVMHYAITNGEYRKHLSTKEIAAGQHKMTFSQEANCISRYLPMELSECTIGEEGKAALKVKLLLEGNFNETEQLMNTNLTDKGLLPYQQPFNRLPYFYEGLETISTLPTNIVDWILLQIRAENDQTLIVQQKAVLVKKNGMVVGVNGEEELIFDNLASGSYYLAVYHRSHLPIMSRIPHFLDDNAALYDFSKSEGAAMGDRQLKRKQSFFMMNAGDFDGNGVINSQDFNLWAQNSSAINIYLPADADGNGIINNQDFNLWKTNRSKISVLSR